MKSSPGGRSHYDYLGPRTTNVAEGWHNGLNSSFGMPHPSLRVFLDWLQKHQYEVQCRGIQLAAGQRWRTVWNWAKCSATLSQTTVLGWISMTVLFTFWTTSVILWAVSEQCWLNGFPLRMLNSNDDNIDYHIDDISVVLFSLVFLCFAIHCVVCKTRWMNASSLRMRTLGLLMIM